MNDDPRPNPEFERDLRSLFPVPKTPLHREAAILQSSRTHLLRSTRRPSHRWSRLGAAAALLLLTCSVVWWTGPKRVATGGDVDGNGRVDIADAYRVAVALHHGKVPETEDLTGDGRVDADDVQFLIDTAVRLNREG